MTTEEKSPNNDNLEHVDSASFSKSVVDASHSSPVIVLFHAKWHPPSRQMVTVIAQMQKEFSEEAKFCVVDGDSNEKLVHQEGVTSYPTVAIHRFGACVRKIVGAHPPELHAGVKEVLGMAAVPPAVAQNRCESHVSPDEKERLYQLVNSSPVMIFIKGTKQNPFCKFSKEAIKILNELEVEYEAFDVFQDRAVRDGLKLLFDWPTFPQLYLKGELIGGVDIMKEMAEDGSFAETLKAAGITQKDRPLRFAKGSSLAKTPSQIFSVEAALKERLNNLVKQDTVMVFMKGTPQQPQCGFSSQVVDILNMSDIKFGFFDILTDNEVREGLKALFDWPTFPQLYAYGELVGGLDVIKELISNGGPQALRQEIEMCKTKISTT